MILNVQPMSAGPAPVFAPPRKPFEMRALRHDCNQIAAQIRVDRNRYYGSVEARSKKPPDSEGNSNSGCVWIWVGIAVLVVAGGLLLWFGLSQSGNSSTQKGPASSPSTRTSSRKKSNSTPSTPLTPRPADPPGSSGHDASSVVPTHHQRPGYPSGTAGGGPSTTPPSLRSNSADYDNPVKGFMLGSFFFLGFVLGVSCVVYSLGTEFFGWTTLTSGCFDYHTAAVVIAILFPTLTFLGGVIWGIWGNEKS